MKTTGPFCPQKVIILQISPRVAAAHEVSGCETLSRQLSLIYKHLYIYIHEYIYAVQYRCCTMSLLYPLFRIILHFSR